VGELLIRSSPTPLQEFSHKWLKGQAAAHGQTVDASVPLAFANASD